MADGERFNLNKPAKSQLEAMRERAEQDSNALLEKQKALNQITDTGAGGKRQEEAMPAAANETDPFATAPKVGIDRVATNMKKAVDQARKAA